MKVIIADKAKSDLFRIYSYVEQRSPLAAEKILARIDKKFDQLTWFPFIGRERSSLAPGLRSAVVGTHLIFYTVQDGNIIIVRVIDGRMDIDEEFRR
jgi:toxin ParE1/3/4